MANPRGGVVCALFNLLVLLTLVACNETSFSEVKPIEFTSQSVSEGSNLKQLGFMWAVNETVAITSSGRVETDYYDLAVNPDGASGFSQVDLNGDGNTDDLDQIPVPGGSAQAFLAVHLTDFDNARYQVVAHAADDAELARSSELFLLDIVVDDLIGYLKASNPDAGDVFGRVALSADGTTLAVGAEGERSNGIGGDASQGDNSLEAAGAVYVFRRNADGVWLQEAYIKASNIDAFDRFGRSVSLSQDGNALAVGADGESSNATGINGDQNDDSLPDAGAVYVFRRTGNAWSQDAYLKASNTGAGDLFGWQVSLSANGTRLAVGAVGEDSDAGAVYVFQYNAGAGTWSQNTPVKASNADAGDEFGYSVSLSPNGTRLAVGAVGEASNATDIDGDESDNSLPDAGAAYVFLRSNLGGGTWNQQAYIKASNTDGGDAFGSSVSLSTNGNALAVGAMGEASNATGIDGDQGNNDMLDAGAVYTYEYKTTPPRAWLQNAYVKASNTGAGDAFGAGVGLSGGGDILAVGATGEGSNATGIGGDESNNDMLDAGAVYTYVYNTTPPPLWSQRSYVKASNTDAGDEFGASVSLSADGNSLAVGAMGEDSTASGIGGDQNDNNADAAGAAYLY